MVGFTITLPNWKVRTYSPFTREYELVATYRLFVSPEYEDVQSHTLDTVNHQESVKVYVRRGR